MSIKDQIAEKKSPILIGAGALFILSVFIKSDALALLSLAIGLGTLVLTTRDANPTKNYGVTKGPFLSNLPDRVRLVVSRIFVLCSLPCLYNGFFNRAGFLWVLLGFLLIAAACYVYFVKQKQSIAPVIKRTDHGSASWATTEEITQSDVFQKHEGLYLGGSCQRSKIGHLMTVAGSRQGKGTCLIIPSLLVNPYGSYVVTDPKGENAFITARHQKEAGQQVYILDPWDEQTKLGAKHSIESSGFNPFAFLKKDPSELRDNCELIAMYLVPENPNVKDPYWNDRARSMIKTFLMHIVTALPEEEHNFWTLYKMLRLSDDEWLKLMFALRNNKAEDELISIAAEELIGIEKAGNTMAGIKSAAQNATTIFESPQIRKSLSANDFDPYSLTDGNCTVYLVIPERYLDTHGVWLRIVVGLSLKACNSRPNKRVNFLLDEFAVMGKMKDVQRGYAFASGQNIVLWVFIQSLAQLKEIYGEEGMNTFISNAAVFQAFGLKDHYTTEYISKMLGEGTYSKISSSFSEGAGNSYSVTESKQTYGRRLLNADEVEKHDGMITIVKGLRINLEKIPYYQPSLANYEVSAKQQKVLDEYYAEQRRKGEIVDWYEEFVNRADPPPRLVN